MTFKFSRNPTYSDVLLAYRQAKNTLALETDAAPRFMLAAFEAELHDNLKSLRAKLSPENWFGRVELGSIVAAPRSARRLIPEAGGIVRVGETTHSPVELSIRLQLQSHPEFAVAEVLYLWEFGPALEAVLSDSCVGYRLRRVKRDGVSSLKDVAVSL